MKGIFSDGSSGIYFGARGFLSSSTVSSLHIVVSTDSYFLVFSCQSYFLPLHFLLFLLPLYVEKYPLQRVCPLAVHRGHVTSVPSPSFLRRTWMNSFRFFWWGRKPTSLFRSGRGTPKRSISSSNGLYALQLT